MFNVSELSRKILCDSDHVAEIDKWLVDVLLFVSPIFPRLDSNEIIFNAVLGGNAVVLFLNEYHEHIEKSYTFMAKQQNTGRPKEYLIRLPLLLHKFRTEIIPSIEKIHAANLKDLKILLPEYYKMLNISDEETGHIGSDSHEGE